MGSARKFAGSLVAIAALITACSSVENGTGHGPTGTTPTSPASTTSPAFPTSPALSTSPVSPSSPALTSGPVFPTSSPPVITSVAAPTTPAGKHPYSINHLNYRVPPGYVKSTLYHPVRPLTPSYNAYYAVPATNPTGHTVLSLVFYKLPAPQPRGTLAEQEARVRGYNAQSHAQRQGKIKLVSVGGRPSFGEVLFEPPNFHYLSFFVFGHQQVLQVSCQGNLHSRALLDSCKTWVGSITFR